MDFEEYEELLRRAGVRRSPGGSLLFEQAPEQASTVYDDSVVDGGGSELSHRGDAPLDAPLSASSRRRAAPLPTELDELRETLCEDDLALIAGEVDFHANALKRAVAGHVLSLQSKLAASVSALEAERRFIVARSITLQNQADSLKEALFKERIRTGNVRNSALSLIFYWQGERDAKDAFQRWRACTAEKKRRRASVKAAELHYARALLRRHVHAWRTGAHASFRERMHAELESRWADGAQSEASKFAAVVARLEDELAAAHAALEREVAARNEAEERFKQAFMRGVCALNFEALAVLKTGVSETQTASRLSPMPVRM